MLDFIDDHFGAIMIAAGAFFFSLIVVLPVGVTVAYYHGANAGQVHESCLVEGKESISTKDSHEYRVYTSCGNFVVQDEMFAGNFRASDTYRELEKGQTYDLTTRGWRNGFMSWFPNIYKAEEV